MLMKMLSVVTLIIIASNSYADLTSDLISGISKGKLKDVQKAIEKGANINDHLYKDRTPLHWAVLRDNLKIVSYLLSKGADINSRDKNSVTPLEYCALVRNLDMIKLLVIKGADVNLHDKYGWTALHYFTFYDDQLSVKYLIVQGALLTNRSLQKFMDIDENSTPLDIAIKKNYSNIITVLQNPDKYLRLANRPILTVSYEKNLGPENILMAPIKGFLNFSIENKGGEDSVGLTLEIEGVSNFEGLSFDDPPVFDLGNGQKSNFTLYTIASKDVKEGTALFRVFACETNSFIKSDPVFIEIPKKPAITPVFELSAGLAENGGGSIHADVNNPVRVSLHNNSGGYSINTVLRSVPVSGCEELSLFPGISNITLGPDETKIFNLSVSASEDLQDGTVIFMIIAEDNDFQVAATNLVSVASLHLRRPSLQAFLIMDEALDTNCVVRVINTGEAAARNIGVDLRIFENTGENVNRNELMSFHYNIPEIGTNNFMNLILPSVLTNYFDLDRFIWNLSGSDGEKLTSINTNLEPKK